jgi:hypothetical protein
MSWVAVRNGQTPCGLVERGRVVEDDDPMLEGNDGLFEKVSDRKVSTKSDEAPVEEATAEPGQKRTTKRS